MSHALCSIVHRLAIAVLLLAASLAAAQEFPARPLRLVVPYSAGSPPDIVARIMATEMTKSLGQPIVVEVKTGANTTIGNEYVARQAPADGYTMVIGAVANFALLPVIAKDLRFDPLADLPPLIDLVTGRLVFGASAKTPWKSFNEVVTHAKANPGKLNYGAASPLLRFPMLMLIQDLGLDVVYIPYAAAGPMVQSLAVGDLHVGFLSETSGVAMGDRFRVLAVTGAQRRAPFLDIPTFAELGFPQIPGNDFSLNLRAGTPKPILDKLHAAATLALEQPAVRTQLARLQFEVAGGSPESAARNLAEQARVFAAVARKTGIKPE